MPTHPELLGSYATPAFAYGDVVSPAPAAMDVSRRRDRLTMTPGRVADVDRLREVRARGMSCYWCGAEGVGQCQGCGRYYCASHGNVYCRECEPPVRRTATGDLPAAPQAAAGGAEVASRGGPSCYACGGLAGRACGRCGAFFCS